MRTPYFSFNEKKKTSSIESNWMEIYSRTHTIRNKKISLFSTNIFLSLSIATGFILFYILEREEIEKSL